MKSLTSLPWWNLWWVLVFLFLCFVPPHTPLLDIFSGVLLGVSLTRLVEAL